MKLTVVVSILTLAAACTRDVAQNGAAAGDVSPAVAVKSAAGVAQAQAAYSDASLNTDVRIAALDSYADGIDGRLPDSALPLGITALTKVPTTLPDGAFGDITDDRWSRMDAFYDGTELKRMDMMPMGSGHGPEVFYFAQGKLVMVARHADSTVTRDLPARADAERFYFGQEGLIAWVHPDGTKADSSTDAFRHWSEKLMKESARFPTGR